ncbi:MAG: hypothetical protein IE909_00545 [Campylobacterales bacterium]|nr:hypothetical protein [Campylobacterales bacterium]
MNQRDDIKNNILDTNGKKIEELLTSVMLTAKQDNDYKASLESSGSLRSLLLARLYTAKFLDSNSKVDYDRVNQEFDNLHLLIQNLQKEIQNKTRIAQLNKAKETIEKYKSGVNAIYKIIIERNKLIENSLNVIGTNVSKHCDEVRISIKKDQDIIGPEVKQINESFHMTSLVVSTVVILFIIILAVVIPKSIVNAISGLNQGILNLLHSKDVSTRVSIVSKDEIAEVSTNFNKYLQSIEDGIKEDQRLIEEANKVIDRVKHGWYSQTIQGTTSNIAVEEFKNGVNAMINATKEHFVNMNVVLEKYAAYDYRDELRLEGIEKGGVFETLVNDINKLRSSINEMLLENKINGLTLDQSSNTLLVNVDKLNNNSNEAAAALEETAAALEQITGNISNNTSNIVQMANLAQVVTDAATEGEKLANDTTSAMNQIDDEVNSINDAITVIDQIAFQTNILSLNAAVEAATAGEAGKGFAVVAQEVRNLASRSAEAANEIKNLVGNATAKANGGKKIADEMIKGYQNLNSNIDKTIELIKSVEIASKEQLSGIEQINDAINSLDRQTQQNAMIASQTHDVALQTDQIAKLFVTEANQKEFIGKENAKAKTFENQPNKTMLSESVKKVEHKSAPIKAELKKIDPKKTDDDEWASF